MTKQLICYPIDNLSPAASRKLHRELYGYKDYSNKGQYVYSRKGLVDELACERVLDSVLLANTAAGRQICHVLKKYGIRIYVFRIVEK